MSQDYDVPFKFTGQIEKVVVSLGAAVSAGEQDKLQRTIERKGD